jgi:hypothetical protein
MIKFLFTFSFMVSSYFCWAQIIPKAEKLEVDGTILYSFIQNKDNKGFHCLIKTQIIIDSSFYDFVSKSDINYDIIKENKELEKTLGVADSYCIDNIETHSCVFYPNNKRLKNYNCDSAIEVFRTFNIYDSVLYKPDMKLRIQSDAIYSKPGSDTLYIALQFKGIVIKYENIIYHKLKAPKNFVDKEEYEPTEEIYNPCNAEEINTPIIVLNKVIEIEKIDLLMQNSLGLIKSNMSEIKVFLYE